MTPEQLAARWLADVSRMTCNFNTTDGSEIPPITLLHEAETLAAIALHLAAENAAPAEDVRAGALKEAAERLDLAAGVYADRAKDTISTNPLSAHPTDTPTEGQLLAYDYDNMQAMLDGAAAAALRAERDAILRALEGEP